MNLVQKSICILGAGPAGLLLGRLLELAKVPYVIFERDESATWAAGRGGSGTLDIHAGSGQYALEQAGLLEQWRARSRSNVTTTLADAKGAVYARLCGSGDRDRPEIDRKDLRDLLLKSVPAHRIRWGKRVHNLKRDTEGLISVKFTDDSSESRFGLVVGADGAWSKARSLVTPAKPQYSGVHYLTTSIKPDNPFHSAAESLAGRGNYIACGEGKMVVAMQLGDGSYYIAAGVPLPENWTSENTALLEDPAALRQALLKDHLANWPEVHTDLIKHSDGPFRPWPLYAMPAHALPWERCPGVTLIGDAAHVTTPNGEGVNEAMYDSVELAEQIVKHGLDDLDRAVSEYEQEMLPRAIDGNKEAARTQALMFALDSPKAWLRSVGLAEPV